MAYYARIEAAADAEHPATEQRAVTNAMPGKSERQ